MPTRGSRSAGAKKPLQNHTGGLYEIKIKGRLDEHWLDWFGGMTLQYAVDEETGLDLTVLRGVLADQPALHGVLTKIRDLNLTLISVEKPSLGRKLRKRNSSPKPK